MQRIMFFRHCSLVRYYTGFGFVTTKTMAAGLRTFVVFVALCKPFFLSVLSKRPAAKIVAWQVFVIDRLRPPKARLCSRFG